MRMNMLQVRSVFFWILLNLLVRLAHLRLESRFLLILKWSALSSKVNRRNRATKSLP